MSETRTVGSQAAPGAAMTQELPDESLPPGMSRTEVFKALRQAYRDGWLDEMSDRARQAGRERARRSPMPRVALEQRPKAAADLETARREAARHGRARRSNQSDGSRK